jgi:hypothetical protein
MKPAEKRIPFLSFSLSWTSIFCFIAEQWVSVDFRGLMGVRGLEFPHGHLWLSGSEPDSQHQTRSQEVGKNTRIIAPIDAFRLAELGNQRNGTDYYKAAWSIHKLGEQGRPRSFLSHDDYSIVHALQYIFLHLLKDWHSTLLPQIYSESQEIQHWA